METGQRRLQPQAVYRCDDTPHSLGKAVEWKRVSVWVVSRADRSSPLVGAVEWKLARLGSRRGVGYPLPTRWGKQLNGNNPPSVSHRIHIFSPHSLGKAVEWKLAVVIVVAPRLMYPPHSLGKAVEWKLS